MPRHISARLILLERLPYSVFLHPHAIRIPFPAQVIIRIVQDPTQAVFLTVLFGVRTEVWVIGVISANPAIQAPLLRSAPVPRLAVRIRPARRRFAAQIAIVVTGILVRPMSAIMPEPAAQAVRIPITLSTVLGADAVLLQPVWVRLAAAFAPARLQPALLVPAPRLAGVRGPVMRRLVHPIPLVRLAIIRELAIRPIPTNPTALPVAPLLTIPGVRVAGFPIPVTQAVPKPAL